MSSNTKYPTLTRAGLTQSYLHTNSTTHQFLFGAVAELLDNARDAQATKMQVFTTRNTEVRGGFYLSFLDDGRGMDPVEVKNIVQFGKSFKRAAGDHMIGQYGNGLKSGSMRIGNDFILFTKRPEKMSALMLSRTFHDKEEIESIICPMPVFSTTTRTPVFQEGGKERHKQEIDLMCRYSPFKSEHALLQQFDKIADETGTLIVIYNMKLLDSGEPELDIVSDRTDIRMADMDPTDQSNLPERVSFKAYAAILYLDPRMKIYVQNKKIRTKRLSSTLGNPMMYKFSSNRFKKRSEDEVAKADHEYNLAEERAREAESTSRDLERKISLKGKPSKEDNMALRKVQDKASDARNLANTRKAEATYKRKSLKDRKSLDFVFGFNIENRRYYGMFIYNCSRLIRMYERVGPQLTGSDQCAGIVGVVNVPYLVLEPTHNKQHFADNKEYRHMLKAMGDHMQCYRRDVKDVNKKGIKQFWESFGYLSDDWTSPPSRESKYVRARAIKIPKVIQCDSCLKWRTLPFVSSSVGKEPPDDWMCRMNPDKRHSNCSCAEEVPKITVGEFRKEHKTNEQRKAELAERMQKIQREVNKLSSSSTSAPSSSSNRRDSRDGGRTEKSSSSSKHHHEGSSKHERHESSRHHESGRHHESSRHENKKHRHRSNAFESDGDHDNNDDDIFSELISRTRPALKSSKESTKRVRDATPSSHSPPREKRLKKPSYRIRSDDYDNQVSRKMSAATKIKDKSSRKINKKQKIETSLFDEDLTEDEQEVQLVEEIETEIVELDNDTIESSSKREKKPSKETAAVITEIDDDDEDDDVPINQVKKSLQAAANASKPTNVLIGKCVELIVDNKWRPARIIHTDCDGDGNIKSYKLKFDQHPQDRFDVVVDVSRKDQIRFLGDDTPVNGASSSKAVTNQNGLDASPDMENYKNVLGKLKTCLRYFLPPNWRISKDEIQGLDLADICSFPMDEFFDHYENGLRCLVSNFKSQADQQRDNAEKLKTELQEAQQIVYDLLVLHDKTPPMTYNEVVPYAKIFLDNVAKKEQAATKKEENDE